MDNTYIFILNANGVRQTSLLVGVHGETEEECLVLAKEEYPNCTYMVGGSDMQAQFTDGKSYVNGEFIDAPEEVVEPTRKEKIDALKRKADEEKEALKETYLMRSMKGLSTDDVIAKFKQIDIDFAKALRSI